MFLYPINVTVCQNAAAAEMQTYYKVYIISHDYDSLNCN